MCTGRKFSARPGPARNFQARSTAITAHNNRGCSKLCTQFTSTSLYKLSAGGNWSGNGFHENFLIKYCITVLSAGAVLQTTVGCKLGQTICLLLQKFSKMWAARRPSPRHATARPGPRRNFSTPLRGVNTPYFFTWTPNQFELVTPRGGQDLDRCRCCCCMLVSLHVG